MSKKKAAYYVVWQGKQPGIYTDWETCQTQVKGQQGAVYKGFATLTEAEKAFSSSPDEYITRKTTDSKKTQKQQKQTSTIRNILLSI